MTVAPTYANDSPNGGAKSAAPSPPPGFEEAGSLRQQARAAGLDPDYWYAVAEANQVKPGTVAEVVFWKRSIALFRGEDGVFRGREPMPPPADQALAG